MTKALEAACLVYRPSFKTSDAATQRVVKSVVADIIRAYAANVTEEMGAAAREERIRQYGKAPPGAMSWTGENDRAIVRAAIERGLV